jgi:hypothetical protein
MKQFIWDTININNSHRVDKQLIDCLKDIIAKQDKNAEFSIEMKSIKSEYIFDGFDEFYEFIDVTTDKIMNLLISARIDCGQSKSNTISINFRGDYNDYERVNTELKFSFSSEASYVYIKDKIVNLLKDNKVYYSFLTRIPIVAILDVLIFAFICIYTMGNEIIFPSFIQYIIGILFISILPLSIFGKIRSIKNIILPLNEFRLGVNNKIEEKRDNIRKYIISGVVFGILIGLLTNFISSIIFQF